MSSKAYIAEFIATFALIFIGAGSILASSDIGLTGVAIAHGVVLMCMIYATGHISGGHVNPAVTVGLWITDNIKTKKAIAYIISQLLGAASAGYLLKYIFANSATLGVPEVASGIPIFTAIIIEAVLTFFLVFAVFATAVDKRAPKSVYGAVIGLTLTFDILMGGPLTGAAMNPARAFGPAIAASFWSNHIVYWVGPIFGGSLAAIIYSKFLLEKKTHSEE